MIPIEQLRDLQAEFEPARLANQSRYKELEKVRQRFTKLFPRSRIPHLSLDDFVQGKRSKASFCYWVERETRDLGHIQGAPSTKFGVYYSKKKDAFSFTKKYKSEADARSRILQSIDGLLAAAANGDIGTIRSSQISPMFKGKILFLYFPGRFINIFSERHVDHFLTRLRLNDPGARLDLIAKKERLTDTKNADDVMKDWTTFEFGDFLYWAWPPPSRRAKVTTKLRDYVLDFPPPEETDPEFVEFQAKESPATHQKEAAGSGRKVDFDQRNRRNKLTGDQGEDVVFMAEQRELIRSGRPDLAKKVRAICKEDDGAGYDILSFELDGEEKQIEVKSTLAEVPGANASFTFHLSANEYEQAHQLKNFYLYVVFEVKTNRPKIWRIPNPVSLQPKRLHLQPSAYYATLTIA